MTIFRCDMPYDSKHLDKMNSYWLGPRWLWPIRRFLNIIPTPEPLCVTGKGYAYLWHNHVFDIKVLIIVAHQGCHDEVMDAWFHEARSLLV